MEDWINFIFDIVGYLIIPALAKVSARDNTSNEQTTDRSGSSEQNEEYDET